MFSYNWFNMNKFYFLVLLIILVAFDCQAQSVYSRQNLKQSTTAELDLYLVKAKKLKKTGGIITLAGSSTLLTGVVLMAIDRESAFYAGFFMSFAGLSASAIGLPILFTGSSRVNKISEVWNTKYNTTPISLAPCSIYNYQTRNLKPGISLRIRF
jgi:hypothetical protein